MGASVFQYISFRAAMAMGLALLITLRWGQPIIASLKKATFIEPLRSLGVGDQTLKQNTPTMGGIIIIAGVLIPTLLFTKLNNIYIGMLLFTLLWMGTIGFIDDYIKIKSKANGGLKGKFKIIGQVVLGIPIGWLLVFHPAIKVRPVYQTLAENTQALKTTIPFIKNNELDYASLLAFMGDYYWIGYIAIVILIITAVSNGTNITDGLDGLAAGTSAISALTLAVFAYLSGNVLFANYLNILYIPNLGEVVIFCAALVGSCIGFLWYNSHPAQIFMGDTGSLTLGATLAVLSLFIRKELLLPVLCGVFFIESMSVIVQVSFFKYTKRAYGSGRRIFRMAPLHHHYQKIGLHEAKIVSRFWIAAILLSLFTLITLKLR